MNATELLTQQHRHLEQLFDRYEKLGQANVEARRALLARIASLLMRHLALGERHFYPAVVEVRSHEIESESQAEHASMEELLTDLLETEPVDPHFLAAFRMLREELSHHVETEENELFPMVEQCLSLERLETLGQEMEVETEAEDVTPVSPRARRPRSTRHRG
jgi:hemerythrin-like domain-containing protein